jgi:hypothetical protein
VGECIFTFPEPHAINVLLYRMQLRKHIHVKYCWQAYFKVFPSQQYRISLIRNFQDLAL